jgi:hypothetical protein
MRKMARRTSQNREAPKETPERDWRDEVNSFGITDMAAYAVAEKKRKRDGVKWNLSIFAIRPGFEAY